jgi:hypothetical protein
MFKKLLAGAAILFLYRFMTKPWKETSFYVVGIIDKDGEQLISDPKKMNAEQKRAYTKLALLGYTIRKLLVFYPLLKFQFIKSLIDILLLKESTNDQFKLIKYNGKIGLIKLNESEYVKKMKLHTAYFENGEVITLSYDTVFEDEVVIDSSLVANTTQNIPDVPRREFLIRRQVRRTADD